MGIKKWRKRGDSVGALLKIKRNKKGSNIMSSWSGFGSSRLLSFQSFPSRETDHNVDREPMRWEVRWQGRNVE